VLSISKPEPKTCWYCEKPRSANAWHEGRAVCPSCQGFMQQGIICIGVSADISRDTIVDKIYRDGNWCVLSRSEFVKRFGYFPAERFDYIAPALWLKAGLPRFGKHGASATTVNEESDAKETSVA